MSKRKNRTKRNQDSGDVLSINLSGSLAAVIKVTRKGTAIIDLLVDPVGVKPADRERGASILAGYLGCDHETAYELLWK
jgi:hypothetical protein